MADRATFEDSFVVVLGASAGGIEALRRVVAGLPAAFAAPIVVAQHVAADRSSRLATILGSAGPLPVITVTGPTPLEPGHVYVAPGHEHVLVTDHRVELQSAGPGQSAPSVDRLLSTASEALGDRLIAVILTGMGSDGTAGAREVRARGGTVVIQDPETAPFPSMPKSLPPGLVDFVASPDELGPLLVQLVSGPVAPPGPRPEDDRLLRSFLDEVRERTGMDFTAYKRPTILRRLQRRVVATQTGTLRAYVRYAQSHPDEYQRLASTFLIKVTQFFRDPELYDLLRDVILPRLVEDAADRDREIRIWSAGCATGEEAYSLAILASELLAEAGEELGVRIFATDLDEDAIAFARRGIYPLSSLTGMPPDLAARYFNPLGEDAEVSKRIRGMVVFGQHDLGRRAPFPRIDLTLCRNVLIYFTPELQRRALHLFAFSLRDGGYLVLGKSESTTPLADHFVLEHARLKVYRRAGERIVVPSPRIRDAAPVGTTPRRPTPRPAWTGDPAPFTLRDPAPASERPEHLVLRLPVGIVVVDARYDITLINGAARRQLGIHGPAVGSDLVHLAHGLPSDEVRARVDDAMRGRSSELVVRLPEGAPQAPDRDEVVTLAFTPLRPSDDTAVDRVLISIVDITRPSNELRDVQVELERARADLERMRKRADTAVRATNELLQANEELTTANALLRTANEDLLVTAEEVQAATEEVETLNEEFQATNEELETLNEELQATNEELNTTNDDLEARSAELEEVAATLQEQRGRAELERGKLSLILDAMTDALMVVDPSGAIVMTNRAYDTLFGGPTAAWTPEDDAGRVLPAEEWPQARAARGEAFTMRFSVRRDGERRWFEATNRGEAQADWASVVVIRDITDRSLRALQERFIAAAGHELRTPVAALHGFLQLLERELETAPAGALHRLEQAVAETRLLGDLVTRLFDVGLIQQGRLSIRHEAVDLTQLIRDVAAAIETLHPEAEVRVEAEARIRVSGDALQLRQALMNLLLNAVVHAGPTEVEMAARRTESKHVVVEIRDRGRGLPGSVRSHLFEPFIVDGSGSTAGLGLGLYLAREIVAAHGGTIAVEDRSGGGTVARVELPAVSRRAGTRRAA